MISPVPSSIDLSTPPPMATSLLDWSKVIIQPMKDGDGKKTFKLGPIFTHGIQMPKTKPTKSPQQDSPIPRMPCEQTPRQPTPGLSATRWLEDLSREPSQHNEPPIPGPSPPSKPPEDVPTCEPEPEVAPKQSTEDPFARPATPRTIIIIDDTPIRSPLPDSATFPLCDPSLPSFPRGRFPGIYRLITNFDDSSSHCPQINQPNIVGASPLAPHYSFCGCNSSKWDEPGIPGGTKQPPLLGTGGLSKGGHHQDSLQISRKKNFFLLFNFVIHSLKLSPLWPPIFSSDMVDNHIRS
ncbi:hypothetical protein O181_098395 [Austropuccinia psidii MF-1]|uniref:Uncharacterized protein n=1 Tax=Austropuccinia psidii MF-1 TaxID=1389203 RepID=A0A9Q3PEV8_9BASI|nr:hypothetical protein [Austropuccinia psidii MF-1]